MAATLTETPRDLTAPAVDDDPNGGWTTAELRDIETATMDADHDEMRWESIRRAMVELEAGRVERANSILRRSL